jgi:hypothetical protein
MAKVKAFNAFVAARTRAAQKISNTSSLLAKFEALGGLKSDLELIVQHGLEAESLKQEQGAANRSAARVTRATRDAFIALKKEHAAVLAVLTALKPQFAQRPEVLRPLISILRNEGQRTFATEITAGADGKPVKRRRGRYLGSREAIRAEISNDAIALLGSTEIATALAARKVTKERLQKLAADAEALSEMAVSRAWSGGDRKVATRRQRDAVNAQSVVWGGCSRLFRALARANPMVADLLRGTVPFAR